MLLTVAPVLIAAMESVIWQEMKIANLVRWIAVLVIIAATIPVKGKMVKQIPIAVWIVIVAMVFVCLNRMNPLFFVPLIVIVATASVSRLPEKTKYPAPLIVLYKPFQVLTGPVSKWINFDRL